MQEQINIQRILKEKFVLIKTKNPQYSVRSFSRKVGIAAGTLSLIMLGKRKVSEKLARKIAINLMLDPQERSEIIPKHPIKIKSKNETVEYMQLSCDQFDLISEWHYFAILNLIETKNFQSKETWIAQRLGLSVKKIESSLEKLMRLGLIKKNKDGAFKRTKPRYRTTDDISNIALRKSHHETLQMAQTALDENAVETRDYTWLTFSFDLKKMSQAKQLIRKFQDEFLELIEQDANPQEVYKLAIQLFPLTKTMNPGELQ